MSKKVHLIDTFDGGMNESNAPSKIEKGQLVDANDVQFRKHGRIEAMGEAVVNSLQAIAIEMASKAFIFTALSALGVPMGARTLGSVLGFAHTGGLIKDNGDIQRFAYGGQVQGQDNVPIMAQAGEFIMRKSAVDEIGVNTLAKLNKGEAEVGGTVNTININIDGNIIGNEEFVRESLIPEIERTVQRGLA